MSIQHDITESLPWDDVLRRKSDVSCTDRRDSMASSRRNSLYLSDTLFDFPLTPGVNRDHNLFTYNDPDPFAPLSYSEPMPLVPSIGRSQTAPIDRLLGDRSESSIPTIVSLCSYSMGQAQQNELHLSSSSAAGRPSGVKSYTSTNGSNQAFNHLAVDIYQRNQSVTPIETVSSSIQTKTKASPHSTTTSAMEPLQVKSSVTQPKSPVKLSHTKNAKNEDKVAHYDDDEDDDEDDDNDDDSGTNRFKPFHEEKWTIRYKELLSFHQLHGHAAVPHTYPANPQLARWVKRQRRQFKLRKDKRQSTMTTERLDLLTNVGFVWDSHDVNWREKLDGLEAYRREYGNCNVPSNFRDKKLATWVKCQRRQYKLYWDGKPSAMSPERILELEKVGFEWEIRSTVQRPPNNGHVAHISSETTSMIMHGHKNNLQNHHHQTRKVNMMKPVNDDYYKDYLKAPMHHL
jgi:hypothetical protein